MLPRECAIEWRLVFPLHLTNISARPAWRNAETRKSRLSNAVLTVAGVQPDAASWFLQYCWLATHTWYRMIRKSCTVLIWVHRCAVGAIDVKEMKFCTAAAELCCMHHALCADTPYCWKKNLASTTRLITDSILLSFWDNLLITKRGPAVTKW